MDTGVERGDRLADISKEIEAWRSARYGKDVRQAQIDLSNKLNKEVETNTDKVNETEKQIKAAEAARVTAETARVNAEKGRATAETARVNAEKSRVTAENNRVSAEKARESAENNRAEEYKKIKTKSNEVIEAIEEVTDEVQKKLDNGDFIGPPGPQGIQGEKGDQGNPGVVTQISPGMFALEVDNGHLMLIHNDDDEAPPLSIQDGHLYYLFEEETA